MPGDRPQPCFTVAGNRLQLLVRGPARLHELLDLIAGAERSLRLLFYIYEDDAAGTQVRDALVAAAKRGVRVALIVDALGSAGAPHRFFRPLEDVGGEVCVFLPRLSRRFLLRNHQKLALADEARCMTGGFNIEDDYFGTVAQGAWRDLGLRVDGPAAGRLVAYYDALLAWVRDPRAKLRTVTRLLEDHSEHEGDLRWLLGGPSRRLSPWARAVKNELSRARRLDMVVAYFAPGPLILRRLGAIARRGAVRLVLAAKSDNRLTIQAARSTYRSLLSDGATLFEYQPTKLHTKLMVIDETTYVGSANFDVRSMFLNMEIMLRVEDRDFAAHVRAYVDGEIAQSQSITPEVNRARSGPVQRAAQSVAYFLLSAVDFYVSHGLNFRRGPRD